MIRGDEALISRKYFPERKIVMVSAEVHGDVVENMFAVLKFLSKHGIRAFSTILQAHPDGAFVKFTSFLDLTEADITLGELAVVMKQLPKVKRLEIVSLPFTHGEARFVVFTLEQMNSLFKMLRELGSGGLAIMYHMGFEAGKSMAIRLKGHFRTNESTLRYILLYLESLGHGTFSIEEYNEGRNCRIIAHNLLECIDVRSDRPNSQLCRGILAGALSALWNKEIEAIETKCIAMGDPYCEFVIRSKKR